MFSSKSANSRALAVAAVAMLTLCSLAAVLPDESDAAEPESYTINMTMGDQFSYTPAVNLENTEMDVSGTALSDGLSWNPSAVSQGPNGYQMGAVSRSFGTSRQKTLTIEATWTSENNDSLTQTASQIITFNVYEPIHFPGAGQSGDATKAYNFSWDNIPEGMEVDTLEFASSGGMSPTVTLGEAQISWDGDGEVPNLFEFDPSTGLLDAYRAATADDVGTYTISVTATASPSNDTATITYTIVVGDELAIDTAPEFEIFVTDTQHNTVTLDTTWGTDGITFQITGITDGEGQPVTDRSDPVQDSTIAYVSGNVVTINTNATTGVGSLMEDSDELMTFRITVEATGTYGDDGQPSTAETTFTVVVFNSLDSLTVPDVENVTMCSATGNPLDALATAVFDGATRITYSWGDGTSTTVNMTPDSGSRFSARHVYDSTGTYAVTITASNHHGDSRAYMLYDATNGAWAEGTEEDVPEEGQSFFEEHEVLYVVDFRLFYKKSMCDFMIYRNVIL